MARWWLWVSAVVLLCSAVYASSEVVLVDRGEGRATIVVPDNAGPVLLDAAEELRLHIGKMTGANLPVAKGSVAGARIVLETNPQLSDLDVGFDGYIIRTGDDGSLVISGRTDAGTCNGVYGLLEDHLGVRWYYPGELGMDLPECPDKSLKVGPVSETNRPRFEHRNPWYNGWITEDWSPQDKAAFALWTKRNRNGGTDAALGHEWSIAVPPEKYLATHPEYYSLVSGRRQPLQLCTSNPEVVRLYTEYVLNTFRNNPRQQTASLSPNDGGGWCECEQCRAVSPDLVTRNLTFVNEVARNVAKEFPERWINFYAYADMVHLPKDRALRCEPNVVPWIAHYAIDQINPISDPTIPVQAAFRRTMLGWSEISPRMGVREYGSWWPVPCAEYRRIAMDTRYYASLGARGVSREYLEMQYGTHLLNWLEHRLLWNPDQDASELLTEFFGRFYGPAGKKMQAVYEKLATQQATARRYPAGQLSGNRGESLAIFPRELLEESLRNVESAFRKVANTPPYAARVQREALALRGAILFMDCWTSYQQFNSSGNEGGKEEFIRQVDRVHAFYQALPDRMVISGQIARWASEQKELFLHPRTTIDKPGGWFYEDHLNSGGSVRIDAEKVVGVAIHEHGLMLPRGREGYVQYRFATENGLQFETAMLTKLFIYLPEANRIEVAGDGGDFQVVAENRRFASWTEELDITPIVKGSKAFRVRIWGRNNGANDAIFVDNFGAAGRVK